MRIVLIIYGLTWGIVFTRHALRFRRQDGWRLGLTAKMRVPLIWAVAGLYYGIAVIAAFGMLALDPNIGRVAILAVTFPLAVMSHAFYRSVQRGDYD